MNGDGNNRRDNGGPASVDAANQEAVNVLDGLEHYLQNRDSPRFNALVQEVRDLVREHNEEQAREQQRPQPQHRTVKFVGIGNRIVKIKVSIRRYSRKKTVVKFSFYIKRCRIFKRVRCQCQRRRQQPAAPAPAPAAAAAQRNGPRANGGDAGDAAGVNGENDADANEEEEEELLAADEDSDTSSPSLNGADPLVDLEH